MTPEKVAVFSKKDRTMLVLVVLLAAFGLAVLFSASEYNGRVRFGDSAYYFQETIICNGIRTVCYVCSF